MPAGPHSGALAARRASQLLLGGKPPSHSVYNPLWHNECCQRAWSAHCCNLVLAVKAGLPSREKHLRGGIVDVPATASGANAAALSGSAAAGHASDVGAAPAQAAASGSLASPGAECVGGDAASNAASDDSATADPEADESRPSPQLPVVVSRHDLMR